MGLLATNPYRPFGQRIPISMEEKAFIFERDKNKCRYCERSVFPINGKRYPYRTVDHILPVIAGGTNDRENLVTACDRCNLMTNCRVFASFDEKREWIFNEFSRREVESKSIAMIGMQARSITAIQESVYDQKTLNILYEPKYAQMIYSAYHNGWDILECISNVENILEMFGKYGRYNNEKSAT